MFILLIIKLEYLHPEFKEDKKRLSYKLIGDPKFTKTPDSQENNTSQKSL